MLQTGALHPYLSAESDPGASATHRFDVPLKSMTRDEPLQVPYKRQAILVVVLALYLSLPKALTMEIGCHGDSQSSSPSVTIAWPSIPRPRYPHLVGDQLEPRSVLILFDRACSVFSLTFCQEE